MRTQYIRATHPCLDCKSAVKNKYALRCRPCCDRNKTLPIAERFFKFVKESPDCHEWVGAKDHNGYGRFHNKTGTSLAHKIAWEIENGPIPHSYSVCHKCDNPSCCRISHLFIGTQFENALDSTLKGRNDIVRKLRENDVRKIRSEYKKGSRVFGTKPLSRKYGVSETTISSVLKGITWKHVH